jgi:uncharacterized protein YjdB
MKKITLTSLLILVLTACGASSSATPTSSVTPTSSATPTSSVTPTSSATPTSVTPSSSETPPTSITPQQTVVPGINLLKTRETSTTNVITISHAYVFYNNPGRFVLGIATPEGTTSVDYDLEPYKSTNTTFTSLTVGSYVTLSGFVTTMTGGAQARSKILRVNAEPVAVSSPNWIFDGFASAETIDMVSGFKTFANALTYNDLGAMYTFSNVRLLTVGSATLTGDGYDYFNFNGLSAGKNEVGEGPNFFRIGFFRFGLNGENFSATNVNYTLRVFLAGISQNLPGNASASSAINIRLTGYVEVIQSQDVLPTSITLNPASPTDIILDSSLTIGATVTPEDALNKNITWTSSDPAIASVSPVGEVIGLALGTTTITATSVASIAIFASVSITVVPIPVTVQGVKFDIGDQNLKVGQSKDSLATLLPLGYVGQGITFTSNDEEVAKVTSAGVIQAWGAGTATITAAATENLDLKDTLTITVTDVDTIASARNAAINAPLTVNGVITKILNGNELYIQNGADAIHVLGPSASFSTVGFLEGDYVQVSGPAINSNVPRRVGASSAGTIVSIEKINFLTKPEVTPLIVTEETFNTTAIPTESMWRLIQMNGLFPVQPWSNITPGLFADRDFTLGAKSFKVRVSNFIPEDQVTPLNTLFNNFWKNDRINFNGIVSYSSGALILVSSGIKDFTYIKADPVLVSSITVTGTAEATSLAANGHLQLAAAVLPANADVLDVTWSSNNLAVATIDANGLVSGVSAGTVTMTATSAEVGSSVVGTLELTVTEPLVLTAITLAAEPASIGVGSTTQITVTPTPSAWIGTYTYTSDDTTIATVSAEGVVTGVSVGTSLITVMSVETSTVSDTLSIVVTQPVISYTLNASRTGLTSTSYTAINVVETNGTWTGNANKTGDNIGTNASNGITFTAASGYYIYSIRMVVISATTSSRTITGNGQTFVTLTSTSSPTDSNVVILNENPTTIALVASGALQYQYITVVVRPIS